MWNFNPRAPCGARPGSEQAPGFENCISIHAPRAGRDIPQTMAGMSPAIFQSTRPVRGATGERSHEPGQGHISIHAPRAGRDHLEGNRPEGWTISIHAPRAGRDKLTGLVQGSNIIFQSTRPVRGATPIFPRCGVDRLISIHAPRAGRDAMFGNMQTESTLFQSTRPVRGATVKAASIVSISTYFNPRAPCGARPGCWASLSRQIYFNPRAPCGARHRFCYGQFVYQKFQSTRPVRGATFTLTAENVLADISIHAPRAGRDIRVHTPAPAPLYFNPRAPCGARQQGKRKAKPQPRISIHAPRAGRDPQYCRVSAQRVHFNPRAPCGARPASEDGLSSLRTFQSTRPVRGATSCFVLPEAFVIEFQSTRPVRGATRRRRPHGRTEPISIHAPRAGRDSPLHFSRRGWGYFNPRAPCGARLFAKSARLCGTEISIHAPRAGRDLLSTQAMAMMAQFQSTRPVRGATAKVYKITLHTFATKGNS